jgi:diacylglycerol O-acyltransferase / wax synthase
VTPRPAGGTGAAPPTAELLRPQDAFFLATETPGVQQHVAGLAILDPSERPGGPLTPEELAARLAARLEEMPRLRQKLVRPALGLTRSAWVDDPDFDLARHVRGVSVPAPGGPAQLEELVAAVISRHLDRSRPLWQILLLDGLADGRQAMLLHLHHAVADGRGTLEVAARLFDTAPDVAWPAPPPWRPRPAPARGPLLATALRQQARAAWDPWAAALRDGVRRPGPTWRRGLRTGRGVWELARAGTAPPSPFNQTVTAERRISLADIPVSTFDAIRRAFGGTANDLVLTAVAHAVQAQAFHPPARPGRERRRHRRAAARPPELRVMIPVAVRPGHARGAPGSWTSTLSIDVPAGPMSPVERLAEVRSRTAKLKRSNQHVGAAFVMSFVGRWAPTPLHTAFARWAYRGHWFNLIVSVLRGTTTPRYLAGTRVVTAFPIVPLAEDVGLTVAALSWGDHLSLSLTAARAVVPDVPDLAEAVLDCIEALRRAAEAQSGEGTDAGAAAPPARPA